MKHVVRGRLILPALLCIGLNAGCDRLKAVAAAASGHAESSHGAGKGASHKDGEHESGEHSGGEHGGHAIGHYEMTRPLCRDTTLIRDFVCQIHSIQRIEVRALEGGYLEEIFVDEGETVKKGQKLFQIMPIIYQAEADRAQAEVDAARIEFNNARLLAQKDVISQNELALAGARLKRAEAELKLRQAHCDLAAIHAPFAGMSGLLEVRRGSLVEEGELLTTLSDNSKMWVYFNVTESEYLEFQSHGDVRKIPVKLVLANGAVFGEAGRITAIEAEFNNKTGTIPFRATFANPKGLLRHGGTGKVRMEAELPGALLIPQKATFEILDNRFVFVVDKDHIVHQRRVTIAEELPHLFVVSEGLSEADEILLEGLRKVREGSRVDGRHIDPNEVLRSLDVPAN